MSAKNRALSAGVSLIELLVVLAVIAVLVGLLLTGVQAARQAAARAKCANTVRQLALGLHLYHDGHDRLPPGVVGPRQRAYRFMNWGAQILPYLEQQARWDEAVRAYRTSPNFFGPPAHPGFSSPNRAFACPTDGRVDVAQQYSTLSIGLTSYLGVSGADQFSPSGMLYRDSAVRLIDVTDGTSSTLLLGERPPSPDFQFGWWYAAPGQNQSGSGDGVLGVTEINEHERAPAVPGCPRGPYDYRPGNPRSRCSAFRFWSLHAGGANFAFADGAVRFVRYEAASVMPALATRAGAEVAAVPD
ncbi:MAG: DUF1559 domain-containing protein [Gemmataceae bacterium]|nr:DUF1559 domain-containing protein [Gemmataceae bacterium]